MKAGPPGSSGVRPHSERLPEALSSLLHAPDPVDFNSPAVSCDCLAHVYGNAADHPDRVRRHRVRRRPADMTDAEWAAVRPLVPAPAWLFRWRGGRPEGYCHRQLLDAVRHLVVAGPPAGQCPRTSPTGVGSTPSAAS